MFVFFFFKIPQIPLGIFLGPDIRQKARMTGFGKASAVYLQRSIMVSLPHTPGSSVLNYTISESI